jgi:hypothetical protein
MFVRFVSVTLCLLLPVPLFAQGHAGASAANSARVVKDAIYISIGQHDGKPVLFVTLDDDRTPSQLVTAQTVLARRPVAILVRDPNPLAVSFLVSSTTLADPSQEALMKLVDALLSVSGSVAGSPGNAPASTPAASAFASGIQSMRNQVKQVKLACEQELTADLKVERLRQLLYPSPSFDADVATALERWRQELEAAADGLGVRPALLNTERGVIPSVEAKRNALGNKLKEARDLNGFIDEELKRIRANHDRLRDIERRRREEEKLKPATPEEQEALLPLCDRLARDIYSAAQADQPSRRIAEIEKLSKDLGDLAKALEAFADRGKWAGPDRRDYILTPVHATPASMREVSIGASTMSYSVDAATGIIAKSSAKAEGKIVVRQFDQLNVEIGAGVISARIAAPKYGTEARDGQVFAVKTKDQDVSWQPAIVANFVCRCFDTTRLQPMFQIGALPVKDNPALLIGVGARLFGLPKGHFGFSSGLAWGWVREISAADLEKPVTGTAEIEERKARVEKRRLYLMFQYVF